MRTLHVLSHLEPSGAARELRLLLAHDGTGAVVEALNWRRALDPRPLWTLAARIRQLQPDCLCVWGLAALRVVRLVSRRAFVVVRGALPRDRRRAGWSRFDRWLLRGADRVLATSQAELAACRRAGIAESRLHLVPPGVCLQRPSPAAADEPAIVCLGTLAPRKGFFEALWAFDILHFIDRDIELHVAGDGPEQRRLERLAGHMELGRRIRFLGVVPDSAAALARASVVWVPSLTDTGAGVALEAMAAARPVVASRWPGLAEIVVDGETGFLVEPGDKVALARRTRTLLEDETLRRRMGEAGRRRVERYFGAEQFVWAWNAALQSAA